MEVRVYPRSEHRYLVGELWQRGGVAFGQFADAAGQGLRHTVQLALYGSGQVGHPFVVYHQGLDLRLG